MKVYGDIRSGNCLKVKFLADYLGISYEWIHVDITKGETRTKHFRALNPMAQIPVIVLNDGRAIAQSNAILTYLSEGTRLLPSDRFTRAKINEWLFWEQYSHEPYIAVCRYQMVYQGKPKNARDVWRVQKGEQALDFLEAALSSRVWLAGDEMTIADIALLAYSRVAHEGGFDLSVRPALVAWISHAEGELGIAL